jgi:hypothetical protein
MYYGARGIVGLVKPTYRPGSMESFIKLMPDGVGFIPFHAGIRAGNEEEFQQALAVAEKKVARLAELGADVVMIMGAPPAMVRGHGADRQIACELTEKIPHPRDGRDDRAGGCVQDPGHEEARRDHILSRGDERALRQISAG